MRETDKIFILYHVILYFIVYYIASNPIEMYVDLVVLDWWTCDINMTHRFAFPSSRLVANGAFKNPRLRGFLTRSNSLNPFFHFLRGEKKNNQDKEEGERKRVKG